MRRFRTPMFALLLVVPGLAGGWVLRDLAPDANARVFGQVLQLVSQESLEELTTDEVYEKAARGLVDQLDDAYAELYSPEELATFSREQLNSAYGGLGMQIEDQQGVVTVTRVYPNTPAERGGVRAGDRILSVGGKSTTGLKLEEVSGMLLGEPGTDIDVVFGRTGTAEPVRGTYTRAVVHIPAVPFGLVMDGGIGYVPLQRFNEDATRDVATTIQQLAAQGARSFVLDLRGNTGGSLEEALMISNLFLKQGQEMSRVEYRTREPDVYTARAATLLPDAPLVVLTDGFSASASEIVAGALQDHDRGVVVGTTSFGKGLVQQIYQLDGGWAAKLTTGRWYTPSGRLLHRDRNEDGSPVLADTAARPEFRSTGGRVVYGGGGITPDMFVRPDTITTPEQEFSRLTAGAEWSKVHAAIYDQALAVKDGVAQDFQVRPEWRNELWQRLEKAGVPVTRAQYDAARPTLDRLLEQRIAGLAFNEAASFGRFAPHDAQLQAAITLLRQGRTQQDLYAIIDRIPAAQRRGD